MSTTLLDLLLHSTNTDATRRLQPAPEKYLEGLQVLQVLEEEEAWQAAAQPHRPERHCLRAVE
jgi:hypothetical protein